MTFVDTWAALQKKRDTLTNPEAKIEFVVKNLEKLLEQIYNQGYKAADDMHKAAQQFKDMSKGVGAKSPMETFNDMMGGIF